MNDESGNSILVARETVAERRTRIPSRFEAGKEEEEEGKGGGDVPIGGVHSTMSNDIFHGER